MNWLAHVFLSENHIDYQLGNILADPLKGKVWDGANPHVENGFAMHKEIDRFTDASEYVIESKNILAQSGRLRGVVIDIVFDYLLTRNWSRYSSIELDEFLARFNDRARTQIQNYPAPAREFIDRMLRVNLLSSYTSLNGIEAALSRIDKRLTETTLKKESTMDYFANIESYQADLEANFRMFFPQLIDLFKARTSISFEDHWLID